MFPAASTITCISTTGARNNWTERATSPIALGHYNSACTPLFGCGVGLSVSPEAAGIAITANGSMLVVANYYNDSISILSNVSPDNPSLTALTKTPTGWVKAAELDLRPGKISPANSGTPGGEYSNTEP